MSGPLYDPRFPGGMTAIDFLSPEQQAILRNEIAQNQAQGVPQAPGFLGVAAGERQRVDEQAQQQAAMAAALYAPTPTEQLRTNVQRGQDVTDRALGIPTTAEVMAPMSVEVRQKQTTTQPGAQGTATTPPTGSKITVPGVGVGPARGLDAAIRDKAGVEATEAANLGTTYNKQAAAMDAAAVATARREIEQDEALQAQSKEVARETGRLASVMENPWQDDTGRKIAAAIAIGLGSIAQSIQGGRNNALDIINEAIDGDIKAQKERTAGAQNTYSMLRERFGDERLADLAARKAEYDKVEVLLKSQLARSAGPVALANGELRIQEIRAEAAKLQAQIDAQLKMKMIEAAGKAHDIGQKGQEAARKIQGAWVGAKKQFDLLRSLAGTKWVGGEAIRAQTAMGLLRGMVGKNLFGALSENEHKLIKEILGRDPNDIRTDAFKAQLQGLEDMIRAKAEGEIMPYGQPLMSIESVPTAKPKGGG